MKIDFLKNGIEIEKKNGDKYFIAYQSICSISPVKIGVDSENYDILNQRYFGDYITKFAYFLIKFINGDTFQVEPDNNFVNRLRITDKEESMGFLKYWFHTSEYEGCSKETFNWMKNKTEGMEDCVRLCEDCRKNVVEHFNEWKKS